MGSMPAKFQKKIVTIFTGGTIGSRASVSGDIEPDGEMAYRLLKMYKNAKRSLQTEFIIEEPYYILSENLTGKELFMLSKCVGKYLPLKQERTMEQGASYDIDGIIIMHGTDTLQYTAAYLSYLFGGAGIPVVLVSSAYPLEDHRANGFANFCSAVDFILGEYGTGVFVSYAGVSGNVTMHLGTRLIRSLEYSDAVISPAGSFYGSFTETGEFVKNPLFQIEQTDLPGIFWGRPESEGERALFRLSEVSKDVLRIVPYVGMIYPEITKGVKTVLFDSYHSGTIGVTEELKVFAEQAGTFGIPLYLTGLNEEDADYETVKKYEGLGIMPLRNRTAISQYIKLWLLCSNDMEIDNYMRRSVAGDKF